MGRSRPVPSIKAIVANLFQFLGVHFEHRVWDFHDQKLCIEKSLLLLPFFWTFELDVLTNFGVVLQHLQSELAMEFLSESWIVSEVYVED